MDAQGLLQLASRLQDVRNLALGRGVLGIVFEPFRQFGIGLRSSHGELRIAQLLGQSCDRPRQVETTLGLPGF